VQLDPVLYVMVEPLITVVVPSLNQGQFLDKALQSIFSQDIPMEVFVVDGGSTDNSVDVISKWQAEIGWWCSEPDDGQAAAINAGITRGTAPYVCWLNSDDYFLPGGLNILYHALHGIQQCPMAYGKCLTVNHDGHKVAHYLTTSFSPWLLANYCFICQPGTLMRRDVWEKIGGLDENLHMALDYDLWWRIYKSCGKFEYIKKDVAATIMHSDTKTTSHRQAHYLEAMAVVKKHTGSVPIKWYLAWPFMVSLRAALHRKFEKN
jgi:glycosyltransferase involved in cell wall biosynthesis